MMFDLNYQDRLTWLKTIIVFDTTRNKYLNPFLGKHFYAADELFHGTLLMALLSDPLEKRL